jgi:hypothetical protein
LVEPQLSPLGLAVVEWAKANASQEVIAGPGVARCVRRAPYAALKTARGPFPLQSQSAGP